MAKWAVVRDHDRQRTYDAENRAFQGTLAESPITFAEAVDLTDAITRTAWWKRHGRSVRLVRGRGAALHSHFVDATGVITLTEVQQTPATLVHELAHAVGADGHGPRFRAALCALVHGVCGAGPAAALRAEFAVGGLVVGTIDVEGLPEPALLARHPRFCR